MQNDKFQPYFSFTIPYYAVRFNGFLQKIRKVSSVKNVQNEHLLFVESYGFVNLDEQMSFLHRLFIDILLKNCILINVIAFIQKDKRKLLSCCERQVLYKKRSTPLFHAWGMNFFGFDGQPSVIAYIKNWRNT